MMVKMLRKSFSNFKEYGWAVSNSQIIKTVIDQTNGIFKADTAARKLGNLRELPHF